jgi:hypothetical protein
MELNVVGILAAIESHAGTTGRFETVLKHEPKSAPGSGVSLAIWMQDIATDPRSSGLQTVSLRVEVNARVYMSMLLEPQDSIDPDVVGALAKFMSNLVGDYTLGGLCQSIDIFGRAGEKLRARAGYQSIDGKMYRVMTVTIPVIVDDVWEQVP